MATNKDGKKYGKRNLTSVQSWNARKRYSPILNFQKTPAFLPLTTNNFNNSTGFAKYDANEQTTHVRKESFEQIFHPC